MKRARLGLAFAALLAAFVLLAIWLARQQEQASQVQAQRLASEAAAAASFEAHAAGALDPPESAAATPLSAQSSADAASSSGRLVVRVTRARDRQPVADSVIFVQQTTRLYWYADLLEGLTGPDGTWTLDPAPLGLLRVIETRGDSQSARISAGETTEVLLQVREGQTAMGVVADQRDHPVAGAELWLFDNQTSPHGRRVGRADLAGRFVLEDLRWQYLGARAPGYGPSDLVDVEQLPQIGDSLRLHLRGPGGRVVGRATDAEGQPLPGAMVVIGPNGGFPEELPTRDGPSSFLVRAAADGSYSVSDVPAGPVPMAAALEGRSPWTSAIELRANETIVVDIVLQPGATIAGTVRDAHGAPVAGASVWIGSSDTVFDRVECGTDAAGRYELRSLPLGEQILRVSDESKGQDRRSLIVVAGQSYAWDPVLDEGRGFVGRVVDERGAGLADMMVFAQHVPRDDQTRVESTGEDGRFSIDGCDDAEYVLEVTSPSDIEPLAKLEGVRPGPDELRLVVPDALRRESSVSGRLVDELGQPIPAPEVAVSAPAANDPGGATYERAAAPMDRTTGAFTIEELAPGSYLGLALTPDWYLVSFPVTDLRFREHRDLGALVFPSPGRLRAELALPEGVAPEDVEVRVEHLGRIGVFSRPDMPAEEGQPLVRRSGPLDPREDCVLCASGPSVVPRRLTLRPASGRDTIVPLALERGARVELSFVLGAAKGHFFKVTVLGVGGETVMSAYPEVASTSETTPAAAQLSLALAPGWYTLLLRHNQQELRIKDLDVPTDAVALPPRVIHVP